jgi:hypothetical protein
LASQPAGLRPCADWYSRVSNAMRSAIAQIAQLRARAAFRGRCFRRGGICGHGAAAFAPRKGGARFRLAAPTGERSS